MMRTIRFYEVKLVFNVDNEHFWKVWVMILLFISGFVTVNVKKYTKFRSRPLVTYIYNTCWVFVCLILKSRKSMTLCINDMDQITIRTPNPKCRLYWCLIEFIDWRYSQSFWYFRPLLWISAPLTFSLVHLPPPPLPCVNKHRGMYSYSV